MPGVSVAVNGQCVGCGLCTQGVCFADAIQLVEGRAVISQACRGCGRCVEACPRGAIELLFEHWNFVDESVKSISSLVNVS